MDSAAPRPSFATLLAERNSSALAKSSGSTLTLSDRIAPAKPVAVRAKAISPSGASILPKGITSGKATAFVAAAAVIGGGIYLATRKKPERERGWAERIDSERVAQTQGQVR